MKSGSEPMREMVGPAGSMSEGAFSRAYTGPEEELLDDELPEDCAAAGQGANPADKPRNAANMNAKKCDRRIMTRSFCKDSESQPQGQTRSERKSEGSTSATPAQRGPSKLLMNDTLKATVYVHSIALGCFLFAAIASTEPLLAADQVPVEQKQGTIHGFLLMKDRTGKEIAVGDQTNEVHGDTIASRTVFRFRDGSIDDEETEYRQEANFQLVRDHRIQKGPAYKKPSDVTIDVPSGEVSWVDPSDKQTKSQHMDLPADLANGLVPLLIQNHSKEGFKAAYLSVDAKPRIVTLNIKPDGSDRVYLGTDGRRAERFNIHIEIGGITGAVASVVGMQPPDLKMWFSGGAISIFVRMEGQFYQDGPTWTVVLAAPSWPAARAKK